jgi:formate C-acetyltransferase
MFVKKIIPRFKNPFIVYRYCGKSEPAVWNVLCEKMAENSPVMIYNDSVIINAMVRAGVDPKDAAEYEMYGCNWPSISGNSINVFTQSYLYVQNILPLLKEMCEDGTASHMDIDEFYNRLESSAKKEIEKEFNKHKDRIAHWPDYRPGILKIDDCFMEGPPKKAYSKELGALDYTFFLIIAPFFGSVIDSVTAIDKLVFIDKRLSIEELHVALEQNFDGHEFIRQLCINSPKYGQDDDLSNHHAKRFAELHYRIIESLDPGGICNKGIVLSSFETDTSYISVGYDTAATPDGRLKGAHLSQNSSPAWGSCTKGLTALLSSAAKTPKDLCASGALNVKISKSFFAEKAGRKAFPDIVKSYFDSGGQQIQCTVTSAAELRAAQEDPHSYRDLMVRITGYSVSFVDMSKKSQDALIAREEMAV